MNEPEPERRSRIPLAPPAPLHVSERWTATRVDLSESDLFALLDHRPFAFLHGRGRFLVLAQGALATFGALPLPALRFERSGPVPPIQPDLVGFASYGLGHALLPRLGPPRPPPFPVPDLRFTLHREVRVYDRATGLLHAAVRTGPDDRDDRPNLLAGGAFTAARRPDEEPPAAYAGKVERIRAAIAAGDVYQVNLARLERWSFAGDLRTFARRLVALDPAPFGALLADPECTIVSASPERFLRVDAGRLEARPIKGTAPRRDDPAADVREAQALLASEKDRAELTMIVDLLRNDLGRVAPLGEVTVDPFPELESYASVHHLVATVRARVPPGLTLEGLLRATFPGGSVTGCPKLAAMALIRELEPFGRGPYCGALGWLRHDLGQLDLALPIRTAFAVPGELAFGVGGAVTWDSDPAAEYQETVHKARSLTRCLS
ncbi:MAG TPA: anthranilate synthase component I family protein [Anaeromyxobacter sp.]|nr:anthranilate synthase component I family protein [Anaeromyxobacter sp.]